MGRKASLLLDSKETALETLLQNKDRKVQYLANKGLLQDIIFSSLQLVFAIFYFDSLYRICRAANTLGTLRCLQTQKQKRYTNSRCAELPIKSM